MILTTFLLGAHQGIWNNRLSLALGIPTAIYVVAAFATSAWLGMGGLIGLFVFGAFL
ncbi:MAG: hypothetical protein QNJ88_03820 [Acidimicrobiia bacterium]|nr:hypothetical protein [Acidimicrobiia bacterium]